MNCSREDLIRQILDDLPSWLRRAFGSATAASAGIPPAQGLVLHAVDRHDRLGIKDIAALMHVSGSAITQLVDSLVTAGLLARQADPTDRRRQIVALTDQGRIRLAELNEARLLSLDRLLSPLSVSELETLRSLLGKISGGDEPDNGKELSHG